MKRKFSFLEIIAIIALVFIAIYLIDSTLEAALDGWNNPI